MQKYTEISQDEGLLNSLAMILDNDKTALSCSSGTAFPTANVQIGQLCFRTDENRLYQTKDGVSWVEVADLSKSFTQHIEAINSAISTQAGVIAANKSSADSAIALRAPIASPTLTGVPKAPTATAGDSSTQIATTAFVSSAVSAAVSEIMGGAPSAALDTLYELGKALGDDANFAATMTQALATKLNLSGGTLTGDITAPSFIGALTGNATTATKLATARTIALSGAATGTATSFDGSANISIAVTSLDAAKLSGTASISTTGNAATATKLATARTINGVSFDGSGNITIGEPTFANPLATYSSGDANALNTGGFNVRYLNQTATNKPTGTDHAVMTLNYNNIWSVQQAFDWRTGDVFTRNQNNGTWLSWATQVDTRNFASTIPTFSVSNPGLVPARVGSTTTKFLREDGTWVVPTDTTYVEMTEANAIAGTETTARLITAAVLKSAIQTHAPTPTNISGNAETATKLATARTINGVAFDGTANITVADSTKLPTTGGTVTGALAVNGLLTANGGFKGHYVATDNRALVPSATPKGAFGAYFTSQGGLTGAGNAVYGDLLVMNSYIDTSGGLANALFFAKGSKSIFHYQAAQGATTWGAASQLAYVTDNVASATKLATARTINGVAFDGTANITIADSTKVPLTGGVMSGNLSANALGVNNNSNSSGLGVSLYAGATGEMPSYGLAFSGTATFGTHGSVVGDWATYFTMSGATNRGWIFKSGNGAGGNVASISANGVITGNQFKLTAIGDANYIANGNGDAASYSSHNMVIRSWWGIGFRDNQDVCRTVLDTRTGNFSTQGTIAAASVVASGSVQVGGAIQSTAAVSFLNGSSAQTINTGGVLVSNSYADATKVPTNGIYSKGEIVTETGRISAPSSAYHYIDLGRDGADRQIFGSYGAVYYFRNTVNDADVVTINNGSISCVGSITAAGNVTAYSDERIKEDVTVIENALTKVEQLNGVTFKRKDTLDRQTGLLAQEVEAVLPEAVTRQEASEEIKAITGDEEVLAVNYGALTGLLVESIKELSDKLKAQQELIDKQTKLIENLLHKVSHS